MKRRRLDLAFTAAAWSAGVLVLAGLSLVVASVLVEGAPQLSLAYLLEPPRRAGLEGGVSSILASTGLLLGTALAFAVPPGIAAAALLYEVSSARPRAARLVRRSLDALAGVPSIVLGLFGMKLFCEVLGLGWSILAGGLTLACMILPLLVRTTEEALFALPLEQRLACAALGTSRAGAYLHVLLPQAAPGILAGVVLGTGRALAETAAVLFTAGAALRMPSSLLDPGRALSVHVYQLSVEVPGGASRAAAAAAVLVAVVLATTLLSNLAAAAFARARSPR